jgi:hypothetical protein
MEKIAKIPRRKLKKPYMLIYDIFKSEKISPIAIKVAKRKNWEIVAYRPKAFLYGLLRRCKIHIFYTYDPSEFLWLINNAEFVITSSFHGTVYSVLFQKNFYSINPEPYAPVSRISDFLEEVSLKDRLVEDPKFLPSLRFDDVDFSNAQKKLNEWKSSSLRFLKKAVESI